MKFRKKPIIVEAYQWESPSPYQPGVSFDSVTGNYYVVTIHNQWAYLTLGDYVIEGPDGKHHYPCKPNIFETIYEPAE